ncbi:DUF975 family protein [Exiguobacterium flavidum]|uniref:DUF975 family protein n=1 Tax=Exiguobacterium flavidum TaxID=2184695 RepID=UPI001E2EACE1|nr:DUF975 family protein [Exiguobacterium flavidum]
MDRKALKSRAKEGLRGNWLFAIIAFIIYQVLSGNAPSLFSSRGDGDRQGRPAEGMNEAEQWFESLSTGEVWLFAAGATLIMVIIFAIALLLLPIHVGYANFNLQLIRGHEANLNRLFRPFKEMYAKAFVTMFLKFLFIFLWSLLLIIPGIIKWFSYSMTEYLLNDHPELSRTEAITASRRMMDGHKGELFLLWLSFLGWFLLGIVTLGIGYLWIMPYWYASVAAFYDQLKDGAAHAAPERYYDTF